MLVSFLATGSQRALLLLVITSTLLWSSAATSQAFPESETSQSYHGRVKGLEDFVTGVMAQQMASRDIAGAVVTVVNDGKVLISKGYGYANVAERKPVDPVHTLFRVGSISKLFTFTALMQQVELGRVNLEADINRYLDFTIPPFNGTDGEESIIRVIDLMRHTPGFSDIYDETFTRDPAEAIAYTNWIKKYMPIRVWPAGTEIAYSQYGATLAGYIVERVSGIPFVEYMEKHIFSPLGMNSSTFKEPLPDKLKDDMAEGYTLIDGRFVPQGFEFWGAMTPAVSMSSTASDMGRFMLTMLNGGKLPGTTGKVLNSTSVKFIMTDAAANVPDLPGYAHGFYVVRKSNPRIIGHGGDTADFHSRVVLVPGHDFGLFVSMSGGEGTIYGQAELTNAVLGRLFPQHPTKRYISGEENQEELSGLMGSYRSNRQDYTIAPMPEWDLNITMPEPGVVVIRDLLLGTSAWEQVGEYRFEQVTAAVRDGGPYNQLKFYYGGHDGRARVTFSHEPYHSYFRVG